MSRVLICVDSFKGSIGSLAAANSIAKGWGAIRPHDHIQLVGFADGGEGTLDVVQAATSSSSIRSVYDQDANQEISFLSLTGDLALVELARLCGLTLQLATDPFGATSYPVGAAIKLAIEQGHQMILVALGGSASTDGGAGAMQALGAKLCRADGSPIERGNRALAELASIDLSGVLVPENVSLILLTDVENPLLGPSGAVRVFAKQKGAVESDFAQMEANLEKLSALLPGIDPDLPGSGAAGGTAFGLLSLGGQIKSGARYIAELIDLESKIQWADLVITGEGSFDSQSKDGKAVSIVASVSQAMAKPCFLIAGQILGDDSFFASSVSLTEIAPSLESSMQSADLWLTEAGKKLALKV